MSWLKRLAEQISVARGEPITADQLYDEFEMYRNNCRDPLLRLSYPSDMRHFRKAKRPQAGTIDVILSFMDHKYRGQNVPFVNDLVGQLEERAAAGKDGEVSRIERKERWRRGQSYWVSAGERLPKKYDGHYALFRVDSKNILRAEPVDIKFRPTKPGAASIFWMCRSKLRVGDLMANTYRFAGITVCQSTDAVIEPAPITLLRAARGGDGSDHGDRLHAMGGFIMGEKDDDATTLFHSRVALVKLTDAAPASEDHQQFSQFAARRDVQVCLARLAVHPIVTNSLHDNFLRKKGALLGPLDARNALLSLPLRELHTAHPHSAL